MTYQDVEGRLNGVEVDTDANIVVTYGDSGVAIVWEYDTGK